MFALLALALAAVGIYGVIAFSVTRRTHEIGVRMALGARQADVLRLVVGQGLKLFAVGLAAGLCGALALTRMMTSMLFDIGAADASTYISFSILLGAVAVLASWIPARRAARVDPMIALRCE
jgi:putative ABC transport system permease protein